MQYLKRINLTEKLPVVFEKIGRWWDGSEEIDIVAPGDRVVLFGECKWWENRLVGVDTANQLKVKSAKLTEFDGSEKFYMLFSRSGFTEELRRMAEGDRRIILADMNDLKAVFGTAIR